MRPKKRQVIVTIPYLHSGALLPDLFQAAICVQQSTRLPADFGVTQVAGGDDGDLIELLNQLFGLLPLPEVNFNQL